MKTLVLFMIISSSLILFIHCDNDEKIIAFYEDGEKMQEGDLVPVMLYQNYPNPFNPTTIIQYDLAYNAEIKLKVYTEDWQKVGALVNGFYPMGHHAVQFTPKDLPSGEYYYTLESGDYIQIRKMKLAK
jgi:hypothetical protein